MFMASLHWQSMCFICCLLKLQLNYLAEIWLGDFLGPDFGVMGIEAQGQTHVSLPIGYPFTYVVHLLHMLLLFGVI